MEPRTFQLPFVLLFVVLSTSTFSVAYVVDKLQETIVEPLKDSIPSKGGHVEQVRKAVPVINTQNRSAHNATQDTVQSITFISASSENTAIPKGVDILCCTANCPIGTCPDHPFLNVSNNTQLPSPDTGIDYPAASPNAPTALVSSTPTSTPSNPAASPINPQPRTRFPAALRVTHACVLTHSYSIARRLPASASKTVNDMIPTCPTAVAMRVSSPVWSTSQNYPLRSRSPSKLKWALRSTKFPKDLVVAPDVAMTCVLRI